MMTLIRFMKCGSVLCLLFFLLSARTEIATPRRILLIYETQETTPSHTQIEQGLMAVLQRNAPAPPEIYREALDIHRFPEMREQSLAWIRNKYAQRSIDVVIYVGNTAASFLPGVPVIYCGDAAGLEKTIPEKGPRDVIVPLSLDIASALEQIPRFQPDAHKLLFIAATNDSVNREAALQQVLTFKSSLQFEDISSLTVRQVKQRLEQENEKTLVLFMSYIRGPKGEQYSSRDVLAEIVPYSHAPIYGTSDTFLGTGIVGGYVTSWELAGAQLGEEAVRILRGQPHLQFADFKWQIWTFDWRQLRRWHLDKRDLPPGSVVLFQTPTFWELYRWRVFGALAVLILQSVLILVLLSYRHRQRRTEKKLRDLTGELLKMQERDRGRIARDLHDQTGRELAEISSCLQQVLASGNAGTEENRRHLQEASALSRRALEEINSISYLLNPPPLNGHSLTSALQSYLGELTKRTSIGILPELEEVGSLPSDIERTLFRIVQESLANVIRHSHADTVTVRLEKKPGYIHLAVEDNGWGLREGNAWASESKMIFGVGIAGMQERVSQLGGDFQIQSSSTGTTIRVTMPVDSE